MVLVVSKIATQSFSARYYQLQGTDRMTLQEAEVGVEIDTTIFATVLAVPNALYAFQFDSYLAFVYDPGQRS